MAKLASGWLGHSAVARHNPNTRQRCRAIQLCPNQNVTLLVVEDGPMHGDRSEQAGTQPDGKERSLITLQMRFRSTRTQEIGTPKMAEPRASSPYRRA
jgi:hypothetical protein